MMPWVKTIPNKKKPRITKIMAKVILSLAFVVTNIQSLVRVVCSRQMPGNTKMKMAAKDPRTLMTALMLGISIAIRMEATNQRVAIVNLRNFSLLGLSSVMNKSLIMDDRPSLPQNKRMG